MPDRSILTEQSYYARKERLLQNYRKELQYFGIYSSITASIYQPGIA